MTALTTGPELRRVVSFAVPLTLANLIYQGYLLIDGIIVGRFLGVSALAAVGAIQPLFYLLNAVFIGLGTGFAIRLGHLVGAGRHGEVRGAVRALAASTVVWSVGCVVLALGATRPLLGLMGISGQLARDAAAFFEILALGFPAIFGTAAVSAFLRGLGNSKTPLRIAGVSGAANAALAVLFVGPAGLGIRGAALATVLASAAALLTGLHLARRHYRRSVAPVPATGRDLPDRGLPDRGLPSREMRAATRLGLPLAAQHVVLAIGIIALVRVIQQFGTVGLAAFTVVARLELFTSMIFLDLSGALTAFVAQNLGAGYRERIRISLLRTVALTVALTVAVSAVTIAGRFWLAGLFTTDEPTRAITAHYLLVVYPFFALYTVMVVGHGFLNGLGNTVAPLTCTIVAFVAVQVPAAYALSQWFELDGVIWAVPIGWLAGLTYTILIVHRSMPRVDAPAASG